MQKSMTDIVAEMKVDLGNPDARTEIPDTMYETYWLRALDEFNDKVGAPVFRVLNAEEGKQTYDVTAAFPLKTYIKGISSSTSQNYVDLIDPAVSLSLQVGVALVIASATGQPDLPASMTITSMASSTAPEYGRISLSATITTDVDESIASGTQISVYITRDIRRVKSVFFNEDMDDLLDLTDDQILNDTIPEYEWSLDTSVYGDVDAISAATVMASSKTFEREFRYIDPAKLMLIPASDQDENLLVELREAYTVTTLPDKYERIVRLRALALCMGAIRSARARLSTPMRAGDFVKYSGRDRDMSEVIRDLNAEFMTECEGIGLDRLY